MIKVYNQPARNSWPALLTRPVFDASSLLPKVQAILDDVKLNGDEALLRYTAAFDKVELTQFKLSEATKAAAENAISNALKIAIELAKSNIEKFHQTQTQKVERVETISGVWCWRKSVGIDKVGIYIPGGTAPLFSTVLMLGIPAKLAGCGKIVLRSPPNKEGEIHPAII